jgi:hypothetical protein
MIRAVALAVGLCAAMPACADDAQAEALKDRIAYLLSIGTPVMQELCTAAVPEFPRDAVEARLPGWLQENREAIARGRQAAVDSLKDGKTIEQHEQETLSAMADQFAAVPHDRQAKRCLGVIGMLMAMPAGSAR